MEIILASANQDKLTEFRQILPDPPWQIRSMAEAGFQDTIEENGRSYLENALIKARTVWRQTGGLVLADDSGLSIDVLDGAPGLHSARFAGLEADYPAKIRKIHSWLAAYPRQDWTASFNCTIAAVFPDGQERTATGKVEGLIAARAAGTGGFGYDPIFYLPETGLTMAQLTDQEKHRLSHRGQALRQMAAILLDHFQPA